jgi:hypothetical protein
LKFNPKNILLSRVDLSPMYIAPIGLVLAATTQALHRAKAFYQLDLWL